MAKFLLKLGDESELAKRIRDAIGVGQYDEVICTGPQFERIDGRNITYFPNTVEQFDKLKTLDGEMLKEIGLADWDGKGLWLFPYEWYDFIPEGYELTSISYKPEPFQKGKTDNDMRHGMLAYGIIIKI